MSTTYVLINETKKEWISFSHLGTDTQKEICGNPASASIVSWYLINNREDAIRFISEFEVTAKSEHFNFTDVTDLIISELIESGILKDEGFFYVDDDEPDSLYIRNIRNTWLDD